MFPRKPLCLWQSFAQGPWVAKSGFAPTRSARQDGEIGRFGARATAPHCYPFPIIWPSPAGVGPFFFDVCRVQPDRQGSAAQGQGGGLSDWNSPFVDSAGALLLSHITTMIRGLVSCGNLSQFFSSQPRSRPVCKTPGALPPSALLAGQRPGHWLRMQPGAARPKARLLARSSAACPAVSPACRLAEPADLTAAAGRIAQHSGHPWGTPRGWPFHFPPMAALT